MYKKYPTSNEFIRVTKCKVNIQKSIVFLYENNKILKWKFKNNITYNSIRTDEIHVSLTTYGKDFNAEKYKTLMKEKKI